MSLSQLDLRFETLTWTYAAGQVVMFCTFNMPMDTTSLPAAASFHGWYNGADQDAIVRSWQANEVLLVLIADGVVPEPAQLEASFTQDPGLREAKLLRPAPSFPRQLITKLP